MPNAPVKMTLNPINTYQFDKKTGKLTGCFSTGHAK